VTVEVADTGPALRKTICRTWAKSYIGVVRLEVPKAAGWGWPWCKPLSGATAGR